MMILILIRGTLCGFLLLKCPVLMVLFGHLTASYQKIHSPTSTVKPSRIILQMAGNGILMIFLLIFHCILIQEVYISTQRDQMDIIFTSQYLLCWAEV